ncbi:Ku protein [Allonocardiopsis opalescens]|uniref:Non-homologous end joining protein Ku n=1 Tax=Allonocardiopsis opalescens TaxID=1144618 RepID=A0A2T0PVG8_9ACTN|nr:Ku protein [Allonocardiopsis opalescens]PRX95430.1 DNA end-binding protein Ku [Allonocardiopsis opalescens]
MPRPMWTGTLEFGLVNVPVELYSATIDLRPRFHQFQRGTTDRIRYRRVNERTGKEVSFDDIVKGVEVEKGSYVFLESEELDEIAPGRSQSLQISDFVDAADIDPIYYQKTYYLGPGDKGARRAYTLLREAMTRAGKIGIARLVMRNKEYLAAVRPERGILTLETLFFHDEIRDPEEQMGAVPERSDAKKREIDTAVQLIEAMTVAWKPDDYTDSYRAAVDKLVVSKRRGRKMKAQPAPAAATNVVDLVDALEASVKNRGRGRRAAGGGRSGGQGAAARGGGKQGPDLSALPKKRLLDMARELGVTGRTTMTRTELEEAVTRASASGRKAAS